MAKKLEKEFELINRIIERYWNRAVGLANAESLMAYWTVGAFVFAVLCLWLSWWALGAAFVLFLVSVGRDMHIYADKAFEKYKIDQ